MAADHTVATGLAVLAAQAPLEPGQLLEDVRLTVRGILRARRDHSASISFLELSDSSDEAGQMLQVCINRAKCDDTPSTKHALEQLNIGDTLCCSGPPGRTRTGLAGGQRLAARCSTTAGPTPVGGSMHGHGHRSPAAGVLCGRLASGATVPPP